MLSALCTIAGISAGAAMLIIHLTNEGKDRDALLNSVMAMGLWATIVCFY